MATAQGGICHAVDTAAWISPGDARKKQAVVKMTGLRVVNVLQTRAEDRNLTEAVERSKRFHKRTSTKKVQVNGNRKKRS